VTVSQLGAAGLVAAGAEPTKALARELAAEWPPADQSDFDLLMTSSGARGRLAFNPLAAELSSTSSPSAFGSDRSTSTPRTRA
jgi:hypothetical protein